MSSIQQGIQAAHAQMEMFVKYPTMNMEIGTPEDPDGDKAFQLNKWAIEHKTMICLNGGMDTNLQDIKRLMAQPENPYPWSSFNESGEAMNYMLTNVAIVLPERIYETASRVRSKEYIIDADKRVFNEETGWSDGEEPLTQFDIDLINLLNSCSLAK